MHPYREPLSLPALRMPLWPKLRVFLVAFCASTVSIAGCSWFFTPVNDSPSRDAPCGLHGVVCSGHFPNASCCSENEECGTDPDAGFSTCPPGYCCYTGDDVITDPNARGASRRMRLQWTPDAGTSR